MRNNRKNGRKKSMKIGLNIATQDCVTKCIVVWPNNSVSHIIPNDIIYNRENYSLLQNKVYSEYSKVRSARWEVSGAPDPSLSWSTSFFLSRPLDLDYLALTQVYTFFWYDCSICRVTDMEHIRLITCQKNQFCLPSFSHQFCKVL